MTVLPLLLAAMLAAHPHPERASDLATNRRFGDWRLVVRNDAFAQVMHCRLTAPRMDYRRGALEFHFASNVDTSDAVYRVDSGPAVRTTGELMEIAGRGFRIHDDNLFNPSGGVVRVPQTQLAGANAVEIEAAWGRRPVRFKLGQLDEALAAATTAGCGPDSFS